MLTIEMDLANGQYFHYAADHGILSNAVVVGHQVGQDILILLQFQLDHCASVALFLGLGGSVGDGVASMAVPGVPSAATVQ